jgi:hypothetical protein
VTDSGSEPGETRFGEVLDLLIGSLLDGGSIPPDEEIRARYPDLADRLIPRLEVFRKLEGSLSSSTTPRSGGDPRPPGDLPGYRDLRLLGMGGMGVVFACEEVELRRRICLKVLPVWMRDSPEALARFNREAEVVARLNHPGIVPVYRKGLWGGVPFFTMEHVKGESLAEALRSRARDPGFRKDRPEYVRRCLEQAAGVCEALHAAHEGGVVHRDVKPSNLIEDGGRLRVLDFGLALDEGASPLTRSAHIMGSLPYMSPEALAPRPQDRRTDIYSLGVTLFEMLTLRTPFAETSAHRLRDQILLSSPPPLRSLNRAAGRDVEAIVEKALEKDPARRYGSAMEMAEDIRRALSDRPVAARRVGPATRGWRWVRRSRRTLAAGLAIAAVILGMVYGAQQIFRWGQDVANRIEVALRRYDADIFAPPPDLIRDLAILHPLSRGESREMISAALARIAAMQHRFEEAGLLADLSDRWLPDGERALYHLRAGRRKEAVKILEKLSLQSGPAGARASAALDVLKGVRSSVQIDLGEPGKPRATCSQACLWRAEAEGKPLVAAVIDGKVHLLDGMRSLERIDFAGSPMEVEEIIYLIPAALGDDGREDLWALARTREKEETRRTSIWRIRFEEGKHTSRRSYFFPKPGPIHMYADSGCQAVLPVGTDPRPRRGLLLGTYHGDRELSFFTLDGKDGDLTRHYLYCPGIRRAEGEAPPDSAFSRGSDIDSLAVVPDPRGGPSRIAVNYGNYETHRTAVLAFDRSIGQYRPQWDRLFGGVQICCPVETGEKGEVDAVVLGNGMWFFDPASFGAQLPRGPRKGFYLLRLAGGAPDFALLSPHPAFTEIGPTSSSAGRVSGRSVCCTVSYASPASGVGASEIRLFIFGPGLEGSLAGDGGSGLWVPIPTRNPIHDALFADIDADGSDELLLAGSGAIEIHGATVSESLLVGARDRGERADRLARFLAELAKDPAAPPAPPVSGGKPSPPSAPARFLMERPLAVAIDDSDMRIEVSGYRAGAAVRFPIDLADGGDFAVRIPFRIAVLDFMGAIHIALLPGSGPRVLKDDEETMKAFDGSIVTAGFLMAGGDPDITYDVSLRGNGFDGINVRRSVGQPGFLVGEPYDLSLGIRGGRAFCSLAARTHAGKDYSPILFSPLKKDGAGERFRGGRCELVVLGRPRYPRFAAVELGGLSLEGGTAVAEEEDGVHGARRAFAAGDLERAATAYAALPGLPEEDAIAFEIARLGPREAVHSPIMDRALSQWPNCGALVRLWAAEMVREGRRAELREKAIVLAREPGETSTHLAELLGELAENLEPPAGAGAGGEGAPEGGEK